MVNGFVSDTWTVMQTLIGLFPFEISVSRDFHFHVEFLEKVINFQRLAGKQERLLSRMMI